MKFKEEEEDDDGKIFIHKVKGHVTGKVKEAEQNSGQKRRARRSECYTGTRGERGRATYLRLIKRTEDEIL